MNLFHQGTGRVNTLAREVTEQRLSILILT